MHPLLDTVLPHETSPATSRAVGLIVIVLVALAMLATSLGQGTVASDDPSGAEPAVEAEAGA